MAAIDKIYVNTYDEYQQFVDWCRKQPKLKDKYGEEVSISLYLILWDKWDGEKSRPIFIAPYYVGAYIIRNCPYDFIQDSLKLNYGYITQEYIDEAYKYVMERNGELGKPGDYFHWLCAQDFEVINGVVTMPNKEASPYELIKSGHSFTKPYDDTYIPGKHFRCTIKPEIKFNTAIGKWMINVDIPFSDYHLPMKYCSKHNSWDFASDYVEAVQTMECDGRFKTIKAIKRNILKWNLPVGSIVTCIDTSFGTNNYRFVVTV